jgi:hypothetical protein
MKDANNLFYTSCVSLETMQILSESFPDAMGNKGVIPGDNAKWFPLHNTLRMVKT